MKVDFDTIIYILITIALLAFSAIGSWRKKKLQQMRMPPTPAQDQDIFEPVEGYSPSSAVRDSEQAGSSAGTFGTGIMGNARPSRKTVDPLEKLEQFLTGTASPYESMEGESMESIVDEEEMILEEIRKDEEEPVPEVSGTLPEDEPLQVTKEKPEGFFKGAEDIERAIIYSEILKRKYE